MKKTRVTFFPCGKEVQLRIRKMKLTVLMVFLVLAGFGNGFSEVTTAAQAGKTGAPEPSLPQQQTKNKSISGKVTDDKGSTLPGGHRCGERDYQWHYYCRQR